MGWISVVLQGNAMTSNMIPPTVQLNGYRMPASYGDNVYPVPPGRWRVDVHAQWLKRFGEATLEVDVAEGQTVRTYYAAPMHQSTGGSIGFEKQPRRGKAVAIGLFVLLVLVVVAGFSAALL